MSYLFNSKHIARMKDLLIRLYTFTQSRKNPVSASAMLTGKFLQIQKIFATSSLLAEEFPDTLQYYAKFPYDLKKVHIIQKM